MIGRSLLAQAREARDWWAKQADHQMPKTRGEIEEEEMNAFCRAYDEGERARRRALGHEGVRQALEAVEAAERRLQAGELALDGVESDQAAKHGLTEADWPTNWPESKYEQRSARDRLRDSLNMAKRELALRAEAVGTGVPQTAAETAKAAVIEPEVRAADDAIQQARSEMLDPDEIWSCGRREIDHVWKMSRRLKLAPWALLAATLGRVAATVPYWIMFRSFVGVRPLNLIFALAGPTGGGKSATDSAVAEMFAWPRDLGRALEVGSGEAISGAYGFAASRDDEAAGQKRGDFVWRYTDHLGRFIFDEVGRLNAMQGRQGSTVIEYLKTAESGGELGRVLASGQGVQVPFGQYRFVAQINVQPGRAGLILSPDEIAGGFPGRMLWASTTDAELARARRDPHPVEAMSLPTMNWTQLGPIRALPAMDAAIEHERNLRLSGKGDAMESHAVLLRCKVSVLLAVLDGRTELIDEDWRLAALVMEQSRRVRQSVVREVVKAGDIDRDTAETKAEARKDTTVIERMRRLQDEGQSYTAALRFLRSEQRTRCANLVAQGEIERW